MVVLDYGSGNVHSAAKALEAAGARVTLTADRDAAMTASGLVVPGVGAFGAVMTALRAVHGDQIVERRLAGGLPVLGICAGMQIFFEHGDEGGEVVDGLGQWPGLVDRLDAPVLPHMGWNTVEAPEESVLFEGIRGERFYFVHSYAARSWELEATGRHRPPAVTWARHGERFVAAAENGPLSATQFHPEKSGEAGIRLLANWVRSLPARTGAATLP